MLAYDSDDADGDLFAGVRFALVGFDTLSNSQYRSEMVRRGGVDAGAYGVGCTHLIVHGLVYDNPICVAARKDGNKVVSELWVEHTLDLGELADADRVLYRPVRDLSGIPGSKSLCICLTGYQKNKREDIMEMANLMGAQFSKSLTHKVTHLICYKFEGEKYKVAKQENINLVNHQWMEDCLMAWEILPVHDYTKSGWELEILAAQANDSEDDEEEAGRSSSGNKHVTRSACTREIRMTTLSDPDSQVPIRGPTISSRNAEIATGGHVSTPETIKNAGGSSKKLVNSKSDIQDILTSANPDAHGSSHHPLDCKEEAPAAQVHRDEANDDVKSARSASTGAHCISNIGGSTVCSDHHVHQLTTVPAMWVNGTETIDGNCLDSTNQNNVNSALWPTPSKETFSAKTLQSSDMSGNVGQQDGGSTPDLNPAIDQSNVERKLTLHEANLRLKGNAASKNTPILSYNRRCCRKPVSLEANLRPTGSPQNFERITISPSMKSDHKISDLIDAESLRDDEVVKVVDKSGSALAQRRTSVLSSISVKPSVSSETGSANIPFPNMESASKPATVPDLSRNSTQSVILTEKEKSGPFKSNLLIYRRASLKLARPVEREKLSESSTKGKKLLRGNSLALHEAGSEKGCAVNSSAVSEVDKRNYCSSLPNVDTEMSDASLVNKTDAVAPYTEFGNVVFHQNMKAVHKEIQDTAIFSECETIPQEETSKVKNASGKRFGNVSNKSANRSIRNKDEVVSFKSDGDKVVSCENIKMQSERNCASPNSVECTLSIPEQIPYSRATNVATKNLLDASEMNTSLTLSKTQLAEKYMKKNPGCSSSNEHRKSSSEKVSQTADVEMPDAPIANSTGSMSSKSDFKEVIPPENARSCPKRHSSNTNMGGPETCSPSVVPKNRARKAVAKRKVSAVQQNSFGAEPCKNGSTFVSEFKFVYSKRASDCSRNGNQKTLGQNLQSSNENGTKDADGSFSKEAIRDRSKILQNSQARSSKRQKTAELIDVCTDDKENLPANSNIISKSKHGNDCVSSNCSIKAAGGGKDVLADHGVVEENNGGMLTMLEPRLFILSGHRLLRKEYKSILRLLKGRVCRDSHHWSFQATHFITPELRRTEKFFAAAAAGRWILKSDYLTACNETGKFLEEEPFEWHGHGLNNGDTISMDAPRKWRQLRQHTGHGAFYGMQIIIYGECISPSLDTLKRAVRAGDGTILATSPPYTRFLKPDVDFAVVSAGTPSADAWVQEFKKHNIPCISADYLVEYVCKPDHSLNKHVLFNMHDLADKSHAKLLKGQHDDVLAAGTGEATDGGDAEPTCSARGSKDRERTTLICGSEENGTGMLHMDYCCNPPL
ncbi:LOW QUALITY PROTEIN: uncharacterized protein LOC102715683 [Oryza brachyantha]|uniref:LOW QUALITY PROTEIN: uncharacterized protein LOC102715683 n=1 Tax=Oryza brachyantha TaxID=4533 RepID=UPI001ADC75E3|nr:LOW QUALITY PROTEIN: uncharacterized protein LOC102715683 [Oryza brachyantha]